MKLFLRKKYYLFLFLVGLATAVPAGLQAETGCKPTAPDEIGPFYRPGAPVRDRLGEGYVLSGRVLSSEGCLPLAGAIIEIWLTGPDGNYGDDFRATLLADQQGNYRFECSPPPAYGRRPPHIHISVRAPFHEWLITQHYPEPGQQEARFDLVLSRR